MRSIDMHQAKTRLSRLVEEAARGEPFVIAKAGKPIAKAVPLERPYSMASRRLGFYPGKISVPEDFDTLVQDEIIAVFEEDG